MNIFGPFCFNPANPRMIHVLLKLSNLFFQVIFLDNYRFVLFHQGCKQNRSTFEKFWMKQLSNQFLQWDLLCLRKPEIFQFGLILSFKLVLVQNNRIEFFLQVFNRIVSTFAENSVESRWFYFGQRKPHGPKVPKKTNSLDMHRFSNSLLHEAVNK